MFSASPNRSPQRILHLHLVISSSVTSALMSGIVQHIYCTAAVLTLTNSCFKIRCSMSYVNLHVCNLTSIDLSPTIKHPVSPHPHGPLPSYSRPIYPGVDLGGIPLSRTPQVFRRNTRFTGTVIRPDYQLCRDLGPDFRASINRLT